MRACEAAWRTSESEFCHTFSMQANKTVLPTDYKVNSYESLRYRNFRFPSALRESYLNCIWESSDEISKHVKDRGADKQISVI